MVRSINSDISTDTGSNHQVGIHVGSLMGAFGSRDSARDAQRRSFMAVHAAHTVAQQNMAHMLVGRRYADRGYQYKAPTEANASNQITLNAVDNQTTLGTITVRFDSSAGLSADEVFGPEINALRHAGRKVCEFTKLALDGELPSQKILAALFHMAYIHAHLVRGFDILAVEVNPRHVPYYRRMLGFKVCSPERTNLRVNAPGVLLCVEFEHIREQIARYGGRPELAGQVRTLFPFAFSAAEEQQLLNNLHRAGEHAAPGHAHISHKVLS